MSVEGVSEATVSLSDKTAIVKAHNGTSPESVIRAIEATGQYTAKLADEGPDD